MDQSNHIAKLIQHALSHDVRYLEPTAEAEAEWVATIKRKAAYHRRFQQECTPGYYNNEGEPVEGKGFFGEQYGGGPVEFDQVMRDWHAEGQMKGLKLS
jgi:hypothetical protein